MIIETNDIGHIIQLSIAPVFLLTGVGTKLMVLTNRLARIIDRSRKLEDRLDVGHNEAYLDELDTLYRRSHLINAAITLSTTCGLLVCLVIAMLFFGEVTNFQLSRIDLNKVIAACFVLGMAALIGSFVYLLREIFIASKSLRARRHVRQS